jgi:hypothetical protein
MRPRGLGFLLHSLSAPRAAESESKTSSLRFESRLIDSATLWDFRGLLPTWIGLSQEMESAVTAYGSAVAHDVSDERNCMGLGFVAAHR